MRRLIVLLAVAALALAAARLGLWQLDRAQQKEQWATLVQERAGQAPLSQAELPRSAEETQAQSHRRIVVTGRWLPDHTVWLDNRPQGGRAGFIVTTPLLLAPGDAVLVQRGWAARDAFDPARLPPLPTPDGEVSLLVRIAEAPSHVLELGAAAASGPIRQNLDLIVHGKSMGVALRPLSLLQLQPGTAGAGADAALARQWPLPQADVAKHRGYALQWFALCALVTGLYVWFEIIKRRGGRSD